MSEDEKKMMMLMMMMTEKNAKTNKKNKDENSEYNRKPAEGKAHPAKQATDNIEPRTKREETRATD